MDEISFGKDEYKLLLELKLAVAQCELHHVENVTKIESMDVIIAQQSKEIATQKQIIANMLWASSKVALFVAGLCGVMVAIGNWLMDAVNFQAVKNFFDTINKGS